MCLKIASLLSVVVLSICIPSKADDWQQFRGPQGNGLIPDTNLPDVWGDANIKWKANVPGEGWSAPIVVGQKVFVTTAVSSGQKNKNSDHQWKVMCLDAGTGNPLWSKVAISSKPKLGTHRDNTYASETPATDGKRLVAYFGMMGVFCYDLDGNELWKKDLGNYKMRNEWGTSSSPIISNGLVFLQIDNEQESFLVALNLSTGDEVWRKQREETSNWGSPIIWTNKLRSELVTAGKTVRAYDPKDGKLLWQANSNTGGFSSSPSGNDELLIVGNQGRDGAGMMVIKAGASGDISLKENESSNSSVIWSTSEFGPQRSSPILVDGQIFLLGGRGGVITCVEAMTGKKVYQDRLPDAGAFWASPWSSNGLVFCPDENGNTFVVKPGPSLNLVRVNKIPEENSRYWATSAASNGTLFIRSSKTLYAVTKK